MSCVEFSCVDELFFESFFKHGVDHKFLFVLPRQYPENHQDHEHMIYLLPVSSIQIDGYFKNFSGIFILKICIL